MAKPTSAIKGAIVQHHSVRRSYAAAAGSYADSFRDELAGKPLDLSILWETISVLVRGTGAY
jgi:hypothetical protein